jgi:hypothetical protein
MALEPTGEDLLNLDLDARLADLWVLIWRIDASADEILAAALRMAYGMGYRDALIEQPRAKLYLDHGYRPPDAERSTRAR